VPECAVGILFLSFILFTVVVFLALAVTGRGLAIVRDKNGRKFSFAQTVANAVSRWLN
jgi:hypothetical protein